MKNVTFFQTFRKSLVINLFLTLALLIGGGNSAWGDELIVTSATSKTYTSDMPLAGNLLGTTLVKSEFIIPASKLTALAEKQITKMSFTLYSATTGWGDAEFQVFLKEVTASEFPSPVVLFGNDDATIVYEGKLDATKTTIDIDFTSPFVYSNDNKNLLVGVYCTKTGTAASVTFKLIRENGSDLNNYSGYTNKADESLTRTNWYPETTFTYEDVNEEPVEVSTPTGLGSSDITPTSANLTWTSDESKWQLSYSTTSGDHETTTVDFTTNSYTLSGLTPSTTYYVSVRAKHGSTYSEWSDEISFTTGDAIAVSSVTISESSWVMLAGATKTLSSTVLPADATFNTVSWESNNTSVATVSSGGVVTALTPGSAVITVKATADETKRATCNITVTAPVTPTALKTKDLYSDYTYLTWTNGSTETTWQIKYGTTSGNLNTPSGDIGNSKKPYLITGLSSNTTYYASIRSKLGTAYSDWSDEISFKTPNVGTIPGGDTEMTEDFESGWTVNASSKLTGLKKGWGSIGSFSNFTLSSTYKNGDEGYGLSFEGYNINNYLILPSVKAGSTISFSSSRAYSSLTGTVKLYKAIKIGSTYYVDTNVEYASLNHSTNVMTSSTSASISDGGYVAILLNRAAIDDITYQASNTVRAITDDNGFTTFANSEQLDLTTANLPSGLKAYKAKVDGTIVKFTEIDQEVPSNTGVLLKGDPYTEYKIAIAETSSVVGNNDFLVNSNGYTFAAESGYTYYGLLKNSYPLTFGVFAPGTVAIPTNKAYLKVENTPLGEARQLTCVFDDDTQTTNIGALRVKEGMTSDKRVYNLNGQRVNKTAKGLYIVDGKKLIVR